MRSRKYKEMLYILTALIILVSGCSSKQTEMSGNEVKTGGVEVGRVETQDEDIDEEEDVEYEGIWVSYGYDPQTITPGTVLNIKEANGNRITFDLIHYGNHGLSRGCSDVTVDLIEGKAEFQCSNYTTEQGNSGTCYMYVEGNNISIVSTDTYNIDGLVINIKLHKRVLGSVEIGEIDTCYMPVNGNYYTGSDPDSLLMEIEQVDSNSFKFVIYEGDDLIFKEHIAVFDTDNPYEAIYRGEKYTLIFNCLDFGFVSVTGFDMIPEDAEFANLTILPVS